MRLTLAAKEKLQEQLLNRPTGSNGVLGLMVHYGMQITDELGRSASLSEEKILGVCGWSDQQAAEMQVVTILGVQVTVTDRTLAELDKCIVDYVEWTDLATGIWQPYFRLRDA